MITDSYTYLTMEPVKEMLDWKAMPMGLKSRRG